MVKVKLKKEDVSLGEPIPWNIYSSQGMILLRQGLRIHSEDKLDQLLSCNLFRDPDPGIDTPIAANNELPAEEVEKRKQLHPFDELNQITTRVAVALEDVAAGTFNSFHKIRELGEEISALVNRTPASCLGAVHLHYPHRYSMMQPVYSAVMGALTARVLRYDAEHTSSLCAASLSANIGMLEYQDRLNSQTSPLNEKQQAQLRDHPEFGYKLLQATGLDDEEWLKIVLQHHERDDHSGYPAGLGSTDIHTGARIISLADSYLAMISDRPYRKAVHPNAALQQIYKLASKDDQTSFLAFIKTLGVFPPGTYVKLENGEIAVVTEHSSKDSLKCKVMSICNEDQLIFPQPIVRDTAEKRYGISGFYQFDSAPNLDMRKLFKSA